VDDDVPNRIEFEPRNLLEHVVFNVHEDKLSTSHPVDQLRFSEPLNLGDCSLTLYAILLEQPMVHQVILHDHFIIAAFHGRQDGELGQVIIAQQSCQMEVLIRARLQEMPDLNGAVFGACRQYSFLQRIQLDRSDAASMGSSHSLTKPFIVVIQISLTLDLEDLPGVISLLLH
jgi:hypothetical protein